jgi:hypothetical protein
MRNVGVGQLELRHQLGPFDRQIAEPPVAPHETENPAHRIGLAVGREGKPQQRERVERVRRRKRERDPELSRLPDDETVSEAALGGDLRRPLVRVRLEQAGEQNRPVTHADRALQRGQLLALQVRKRRNEVEVPVSAGHRCPSA